MSIVLHTEKHPNISGMWCPVCLVENTFKEQLLVGQAMWVYNL